MQSPMQMQMQGGVCNLPFRPVVNQPSKLNVVNQQNPMETVRSFKLPFEKNNSRPSNASAVHWERKNCNSMSFLLLFQKCFLVLSSDFSSSGQLENTSEKQLNQKKVIIFRETKLRSDKYSLPGLISFGIGFASLWLVPVKFSWLALTLFGLTGSNDLANCCSFSKANGFSNRIMGTIEILWLYLFSFGGDVINKDNCIDLFFL